MSKLQLLFFPCKNAHTHTNTHIFANVLFVYLCVYSKLFNYIFCLHTVYKHSYYDFVSFLLYMNLFIIYVFIFRFIFKSVTVNFVCIHLYFNIHVYILRFIIITK